MHVISHILLFPSSSSMSCLPNRLATTGPSAHGLGQNHQFNADVYSCPSSLGIYIKKTGIIIAGEELDVILDTGSTDTFVYSVQPTPFQGIDPNLLPPLFQNGTAQGVIDTGLTYEAQYGSGNGITTTLGAIQLADVALVGTGFAVTNLTFANL